MNNETTAESDIIKEIENLMRIGNKYQFEQGTIDNYMDYGADETRTILNPNDMISFFQHQWKVMQEEIKFIHGTVKGM